MWHLVGHSAILQRARETSTIGRAHFLRGLCCVATWVLCRGRRGRRWGGSRNAGSSSVWWWFPSILQALLSPSWSIMVSWSGPNIAGTGAPCPTAPLLSLPILSDPELLICVPILTREVLHHRSVKTSFQVVSHFGVFCIQKKSGRETFSWRETTGWDKTNPIPSASDFSCFYKIFSSEKLSGKIKRRMSFVFNEAAWIIVSTDFGTGQIRLVQ